MNFAPAGNKNQRSDADWSVGKPVWIGSSSLDIAATIFESACCQCGKRLHRWMRQAEACPSENGELVANMAELAVFRARQGCRYAADRVCRDPASQQAGQPESQELCSMQAVWLCRFVDIIFMPLSPAASYKGKPYQNEICPAGHKVLLSCFPGGA